MAQYITKEGLEKFQGELNELKNVKRKEVIKRIAAAKEMGDLSENADYTDAKEQQGFIEGRIIELENLVNKGIVIKKEPGNSDEVDLGDTITVELENGDKKDFTIVGSNEADPAQGVISNESPIGQAFLGQKRGDTVEVTVPKGIITYKILNIQ